MSEKVAENLTEAYGNFDPGYVLGPNSIFLIDPFGDNTSLGERQMVKSSPDIFYKWFLIGHRGCGKSTYLRVLLDKPSILEKFAPISFRIVDVVDMSDLNYQDVLFASATKLAEFADQHDALDSNIKQRFTNWSRTLIEETVHSNEANVEVKGGMSAYFASFIAKLRTQYSTRKTFRVKLEPQISELIGLINEIAEQVYCKLGRHPIIAIDDIDKVSPEAAKGLFGANYTSIVSPRCHFIFTTPVSIMHEPEWQNIRDSYWYLPNIKIYERNQRSNPCEEGIKTMTEFIYKRISHALIAENAVREAILYGGGVFRQTSSILQIASDIADMDKKMVIDIESVRKSTNNFANAMIPQLTNNDLKILSLIKRDNSDLIAYETPKLLHNLSVLLYPGDENWHDVNPVLWKRVDEYDAKLNGT